MFHDERLKSLAALLDNMHRITGLKFALLDEQAREIYTASYQTGFCMQLKRAPGGFQRCTTCDREMILRASDGEGMYQYRCHVGLIEVAVPGDGGRAHGRDHPVRPTAGQYAHGAAVAAHARLLPLASGA